MTNLFRTIYNTIVRPKTPNKISIHNGVAAREVYLFDSTDVFPGEKKHYLGELSTSIESGDTVVQIGAGAGVSTVVASELSAPEGKAITYEAGYEQAKIAEDTIELNRKTWRETSPVEIKHALVGEAVNVYGEAGDPEIIAPNELPERDVLALDCEGAELDILQDILHTPKQIIVETHGWLGSGTDEVVEVLTDLGYEIETKIGDRPTKDNYIIRGFNPNE